MKIPLVSQYSNIGSGGSFIKPTSFGFGGSLSLGSNGGLGSALKINQSDESVKIDLEGKVEKLSEIDTDDRGIRIGGFMAGALSEIVRLSKRINDLKDNLNSSIGTEEEFAAKQEELIGLANEIERITTSDPFKDALNAAQSVASSMQYGAVSRRSLGGVSALLGDEFLRLVAGGRAGTVSQITRGLEKFSGVSANSLLNDDSTANSLISLGSSLLNSLNNAPTEKEAEIKEEAAEEVVYIDPPTLSESSFATAGGIALSFKSYQGKDLIRAIASGHATDPDLLFQLSIKAPDEKDKNDKIKEDEDKSSENKSGVSNGLRVEE